MKKAMISLGLVIVMLFGVAYVYAQDPGTNPRYRWMHSRGFWDQGKRINLTPEQKVKFQELLRKFIEENAQLIGGLVAKRLELRLLWTDPKADSQTILAKEKELRNLQNQMKDKIFQYRLEARNFLTPQQIEKLRLMGGMGLGFGRGFRMGYEQGMERRGMMGHSWGMGRYGMWQ
jgi:Spy/CpxP family protein refolding chaperone